MTLVYKLNNSYTTYVNYDYINDCVDICKTYYGHSLPCKKQTNNPKLTVTQNSVVLLVVLFSHKHTTLTFGTKKRF